MMTIELADVFTVDTSQDALPPLTVGLYAAFLMKGKAGRDSLAVYLHLLFTYRKQHTNRVWATNQYLQTGLGMGERRVKRARALLVKMRLISNVQKRDEKGRVTKVYTLLSLLPNPGPPTSAGIAPMDSTSALTGRVATSTGGPGRQMLEEEIKCLKKKEKEEEIPFSLRSKMKDQAKKRAIDTSFMTPAWWKAGEASIRGRGVSLGAIEQNWAVCVEGTVKPASRARFFWEDYHQYAEYRMNEQRAELGAKHRGEIHPSVFEAIARAEARK